MRLRSWLFCRVGIGLLVIFMGGQACTLSFNFPSGITATPGAQASPPTPQPVAQTTFVASLPEPLQPGETLTLAVMDEVTGLSVNAVFYTMAPRESLTYTAVVPLPLHGVVKYRYMRRSDTQVAEDTSLGTAIRYRLFVVTGPAEIQDVVADWSDRTYSRPTGIVQGRVQNADTGTPVPNMLVTAGGLQYITDSAGRFELGGLPAGTHNLVVYAMDATYEPFQQGAAVAAGQTTSVDVRVKSAPAVAVTFLASVPVNTVAGVPLRVAGNLLQMGNTFADLQGGLNTSPDRMPIMSLTADGRYSVTLSLPVGAYIQYKYTLGDGFWNAEHKASGAFMLREFVVPPQDAVINDTVQTWQAGNASPILFEVTVPAETPPADIVYIQFNPYGWTEPIPMWPLGHNQWAYKLYGPLNMLGPFGYRYCRNGQCGVADAAATQGDAVHGYDITTTLVAQDIQDVVRAWAWFENPEPTTLIGSAINARPAGFVSGVEFQAGYRPNWSYYAPQALANVQALGANEIVLTPSWSYSSVAPLTFAPLPGQDPLWTDSAIMISQARALGLQVAIFPTPRFPGSHSASTSESASAFWQAAPRDAGWWQAWYDHYRAFGVNYADLASQTGAKALILGGDWVAPALPGGVLADGTGSNVPADVDAKWKAIILEVRQHFAGTVLWALPFPAANSQVPLPFLQDTDGVYLLWSAGLATSSDASKADYVQEAGRILDNEVSPLPSLIGKPIYLAVAYPSAAGTATGCIAGGTGGCLDWMSLSRPGPGSDAARLDLQEQADLYEALLTAVNARPWVGGVISRGYYLPAALQDKSASVHGKPAADILWYWLPRLTGIVQ